ncbi:hypothetical protein [uncultured Ruminococcus sp.]|uniref:hypothetical protein n=1 Tax=uncultured Ruminococcus sp. TaxID=165186 RepID=UPI002931B3B1|nr:hypothetical protein [uncultured Ruminococcus sp.]
MYSKKPSILACVTGQYDCDRIIETAAAIAEEQECELRVLSVLRPTEDYSNVTDVLEYLHRVSKANGADMTVIFSAYAPAAAAQFVNDNNVSRIVTGMHDGGNESFLVMFNQFAPDVSITMVAKDNIVYSMDIAREKKKKKLNIHIDFLIFLFFSFFIFQLRTKVHHIDFPFL